MAEKHALIPEPIAMYTQTDALNETKDMSKNLMSGDFERQYTGAIVDKCDRRRKAFLVTGAAVLVAMVVGLLVLAVFRDVQVARLRAEVDELSASMLAISASVKSLNQKITNNKHFNDFKPLEDTIYADEDQDITTLEDDAKDSEKDKSTYDSLEKLHDLTVLEGDNIGDDEDMLDAVDDAESGDWYPDYDKRAEKIGTTNMVHLRPEDFTDTVVTFNKDETNIRELRRIINANPENPDLPALQTVPESTTADSKESERSKRSVFSDVSEAVDQFSAPRMVAKPEERRKTKKFLGNTDHSAKMSMHTVTRTARNSDNEDQRRPFVAAHFHGNTSHLSTEIHEHYKGNGLVRVSHGAAHDVWYPAPWTVASPHPRPTLTRNGHIHVHHTGVYLVYAQIYYLDSHDIISWVLHRTNPELDGRETLLQCAQSSHTSEPMDKPNSCFSASALFLKAGDRLAVRNTGGDRHSLMQPEKSFIGLIKLADAEDPAQEL
ncbi:protein eiger [Manduca sexta]|uniref:THD domain-containing protein n=1 Tax=Manduca sexta TaxID=7130 RepID=A0A921YWQ5_MANSE|nr:protein eiger [Manduca sexta]KAG6447042.1 hypothetical protein O3G_MSEX004745 [Manduca sexta]